MLVGWRGAMRRLKGLIRMHHSVMQYVCWGCAQQLGLCHHVLPLRTSTRRACTYVCGVAGVSSSVFAGVVCTPGKGKYSLLT